MPLNLCQPVLVDEPSLLGFYPFPARSADDCLRFSKEHVGLREGQFSRTRAVGLPPPQRSTAQRPSARIGCPRSRVRTPPPRCAWRPLRRSAESVSYTHLRA